MSGPAPTIPAPLAARLRPYAALSGLVGAVLTHWPEHATFLDKRFAGSETADLAHADALAALVRRLCGAALDRCCADYRSLCARLLEEELYFRRHDRYRVTSVAQATAEVYADPAFMAAYMNGLLLSQPLWANHAGASRLFVDAFLAAHPNRYRHLEVGPGHGLLLFFAARDRRCAGVAGWDVSPTSLAMTAAALRTLGIARRVRLAERSVLAAAPETDPFDSIAVSEVLEHLDDPQRALARLRHVLRPGGRIFVNMPVNSPAPDHIFLVRTPEEVVALVRGAGLRIEQSRVLPASGYDEARARRLQVTMSVVVIASRAP